MSVPTEDAKLILRWVDQRTEKHYLDFKTDVDPKNKMMRLRMLCRICRYPVIAETSWAYPKWDKWLAETLLKLANSHSFNHNKKLII